MKKVFLSLIITLVVFNKVKSQTIDIPLKKIYAYKTNKFLYAKDSIIEVFDNPLIEVFKFNVKFKKVTFNKKSQQIHMIGKTCFSDTSTCSGLQNVAIYQAQQNENNLNKLKLIGVSSTGDTSEKGSFDITFEVSKGESILFNSGSSFYSEEFKNIRLLIK